jgi:hypothetical protein
LALPPPCVPRDSPFNPFGAAGSYSVNGGNQAVAAGTGINAAVYSDLTAPDVSVGADINLPLDGLGHTGGVMLREDSQGNAYVGYLTKNGSGTIERITIGRYYNGALTPLAFVSTPGVTSGTLRLEAFGTQLKLYLNGTLMVSTTDAVLTAPGGAGLWDKGGGTQFANFVAYLLLPAPATFTDNFARPVVPTTTLGDPWSVDQGGFTINASNEAVAAALVQSEATLYGANFTSVDESVTIASQGTSAGLLARWNSVTQTGYEVTLTGTTLTLFRVQGGAVTQIGTATTSSATGTLRLVVSGNNLQVFFTGNVSPLINVTDLTPLSGPGTVGLFSRGGSIFGTYSVTGS